MDLHAAGRGQHHTQRRRLAALLFALAGAMPAAAQTAAALFGDADLALGAQLLREHRCAECHARKVGGDGSAIYRPQGRIQTPARLRGMVQLCSVELKLQLFDEEVSAIAAVLNRNHYRFP